MNPELPNQVSQSSTQTPLYKNKWFLITISIILIIVIILAALLFVMDNRKNDSNNDQNSNQPTNTVTPTSTITTTVSSTPVSQQLIWQLSENGWVATQTPPECTSARMVQAPADLSKVTSILYPGQTRGGNYKPHGGFRFDNNSDNNITVTAPFDGFIVQGGHYLAEGEIQYTFDVMNNCGVMYRVGHFREIPSDLLQLTKNWSPAVEGDSRTNMINPPVFIEKGHTLATTIGIKKTKNVFFDFGVYDYRSLNEASIDSLSYQENHKEDIVLSWHAVCWFSWLDTANERIVMSLPAGDPQSGKKSDYCK
jgi:hypothetical protein